MSLSANGGRVIIGAPAGGLVKQIAQPLYPEFRFEWHPQIGKVYCIEMQMPKTEKGEYHAGIIGEHCENEGRAYGAVQSFLRGYRRGKRNEIVALVVG